MLAAVGCRATKPRELPGGVRTACVRGSRVQRYLDCGLLAEGFVRVYCSQCKEESLVAFSCKDRGFCPSCAARRAAQTAAHLVDEVLPHVALRQCVLAFPFDLHHRLARDAELESRLLSVFIDELGAHLSLERLLRESYGVGR